MNFMVTTKILFPLSSIGDTGRLASLGHQKAVQLSCGQHLKCYQTKGNRKLGTDCSTKSHLKLPLHKKTKCPPGEKKKREQKTKWQPKCPSSIPRPIRLYNDRNQIPQNWSLDNVCPRHQNTVHVGLQNRNQSSWTKRDFRSLNHIQTEGGFLSGELGPDRWKKNVLVEDQEGCPGP